MSWLCSTTLHLMGGGADDGDLTTRIAFGAQRDGGWVPSFELAGNGSIRLGTGTEAADRPFLGVSGSVDLAPITRDDPLLPELIGTLGRGFGQLQRGRRALDLGLELTGVDLCQNLARADIVAFLGVDREQGARELRIDTDSPQRLEHPGDGARSGHGAAAHRRDLNRRWAIPGAREIAATSAGTEAATRTAAGTAAPASSGVVASFSSCITAAGGDEH